MKVFIWFLIFLGGFFLLRNYFHGDGKYDYFQLVQQWPPTYCSVSSRPNCHSPLKFTIHGLWPSDSKNAKPPSCTGSPFDFQKISSLESNLKVEWPDLNGNNPNFWRHEWEKHGICSEKMFGELKYFSTTLELKNRVDLLDCLKKAKIEPKPKILYESSKISEAIKQGTGFIPRLWCKNMKLLEISLCVDNVSSLNFRDCPPVLLNYLLNKCEDRVGFPDQPVKEIDEKDEFLVIDEKDELLVIDEKDELLVIDEKDEF